MNYLAHYMIDGEEGHPYYNLGLILPDLMGIYQRGWKVPAFNPEEMKQPETVALMKGVLRHHEIDQGFHKSAWFQQNKDRLTRQIQAAGITNPPYKLFFLSHILLELVLDRVIVRKHPDIASSLYDELDKIEYQHLEAFFAETATEQLPAFRKFFDFFVGKRLVLHYTNNDKLMEVVDNVISRVNHPPLNDKGREKFKSIIEEEEAVQAEQYRDIIAEMKRI